MNFLMALWLAFPQSGPTPAPNPAYPIRIQILSRSMEHSPFYNRMWGRADLTSPELRGFDYDTTCSEIFMVSQGEERYSARWKKQDHQLEMLVSRIGTGKANKCTLKIDLQPFAYIVLESGAIGTRPLP